MDVDVVAVDAEGASVLAADDLTLCWCTSMQPHRSLQTWASCLAMVASRIECSWQALHVLHERTLLQALTPLPRQKSRQSRFVAVLGLSPRR